PAQMKAFGQRCPEHAGQKDVEQIEEGADASNRDDGAMRAGNRQAVQARSDGYGSSHEPSSRSIIASWIRRRGRRRTPRSPVPNARTQIDAAGTCRYRSTSA